MKKLNTKLMNDSYLYQISHQIKGFNKYYGREVVFQELSGDSSQDDIMLQIHIDNLYSTFGVNLMNKAVDMIFETELKKVG